MIHTEVNTNPYPGLRPFHEDENHLFFGRESQVDELINKLSTNKFLAVVGTSGSGKSSLVNCGLFPALHGGYMTSAGSAWRVAVCRPGNDPIREMAYALTKKGVLFQQEMIGEIPLSSIILTNLERSELGLVETYHQARLRPNENLLVVVDQFEELFRFRKLRNDFQQPQSDNSDDATAFVNLFLTASQQTEVPIYVVITMRSDFLGDCSAFRGLPEAINQGQYLVPRMKRSERKRAIAGPIEVAGVRLTDRLLMRLVNDVGDYPDQLSILQHALNRTWAEWEKEGETDQSIDLEHYDKIGTMAAALDQHAECTYHELKTARAKKICEKMFKALTEVGMDSRGVRRPTKLGKLCEIIEAKEEEVKAVIDVFRKPSRSFLMPPADRTLDEETIIDISHESFMRIWKRLVQWTEEEQGSVRTYRYISDAALLYKEEKSSLLGNPYLQYALNWKKTQKPNAAWASRYDNNFEEVLGFLHKSKENWLKEEEEKKNREMLEQQRKEEEQKRKAEEERRKNEIKRTRQLIVIVSLAAVISLGFAIYGFKQKNNAEDYSKQLEENEKKIIQYFGNSVDLDQIILVSSLLDTIQQMEIAGTTDAALRSRYENLVNGYQDYLSEDSIRSYNNKIRLLGSFESFLSQDESGTVPISRKLSNWKEFVAYPRNTPQRDSALINKIPYYENYIAENATILNEEDFVTASSIQSDMSMPIVNTDIFNPGTVYMWVRVNAPKEEKLTVKWYSDGQVLNTGDVVIDVPNTTDRGFRIRYPQTYNSSRIGKHNEVRLYNGNNDLIGRKVFEIKDENTKLSDVKTN